MLKGRFKQCYDRRKSSEKLGRNNLPTRLHCFEALCLNLDGRDGKRRDWKAAPQVEPCSSLCITQPPSWEPAETWAHFPVLGLSPSWNLLPSAQATTFLRMRSTDRALETGSQAFCISEENLETRPLTYLYRLASSFIIMGNYLKGTSLFSQILETKWKVILIQSLFGEHFSSIPVQLLLNIHRFNFSVTISQVFVFFFFKSMITWCVFQEKKNTLWDNFAFRLHWDVSGLWF